MLDQFASSYGLLEEVDWQCIFSSFYEVVRMKIKCTDMSKFPKEMLFCIDKKLYKIVIDMGKMDSAADRGKGDGSGIDKKDEKDDEDNLDDVDDLGEDTTHDAYMDVSRNENESQLEQKGLEGEDRIKNRWRNVVVSVVRWVWNSFSMGARKWI
jgi:hypothetical protein